MRVIFFVAAAYGQLDVEQQAVNLLQSNVHIKKIGVDPEGNVELARDDNTLLIGCTQGCPNFTLPDFNGKAKAKCPTFTAGEQVVVTRDFTSSDDRPRLVPAGSKGTVNNQDENGNVWIDFDRDDLKDILVEDDNCGNLLGDSGKGPLVADVNNLPDFNGTFADYNGTFPAGGPANLPDYNGTFADYNGTL